MCLLAGVLLVGVLLAGVLPLVVLLAVEEMVLAESLFLEEKERIPPEWEIPEEEEELLLSGALPVLWYLWYPFSFAGWTGGIGTFAFGSCQCTGLLLQKKEFVSANTTDVKIRLV